MQAIDVRRELALGTGDAEYLATLQGALQEGFAAFKPDLVL